jgi:hypothetical protein
VESQALLQSSPGVTALIRRYLGDSGVTAISHEYTRAVMAGGNHEIGVIRDEGVSFNPRLARILTILLQEGKVREISVLCFALRCGQIKCDSTDNPLPSVYRSGYGLREASLETTLSDATIALVASAYCLDAIRHLHMTTFSREIRGKFLEEIEKSLTQLSIPLSDSEVPRRLTHAILLQRRRLAAHETTQRSEERQ